jgi:hypothetical protein
LLLLFSALLACFLVPFSCCCVLACACFRVSQPQGHQFLLGLRALTPTTILICVCMLCDAVGGVHVSCYCVELGPTPGNALSLQVPCRRVHRTAARRRWASCQVNCCNICWCTCHCAICEWCVCELMTYRSIFLVCRHPAARVGCLLELFVLLFRLAAALLFYALCVTITDVHHEYIIIPRYNCYWYVIIQLPTSPQAWTALWQACFR